MLIEVKHPPQWEFCVECPIRNGEFVVCNINSDIECPERIDNDELNDNGYNIRIPASCPLRKEEITVKLDKETQND